MFLGCIDKLTYFAFYNATSLGRVDISWDLWKMIVYTPVDPGVIEIWELYYVFALDTLFHLDFTGWVLLAELI